MTGSPSAGGTGRAGFFAKLQRWPLLATAVAVLLGSGFVITTLFTVTDPGSSPVYTGTTSVWRGSTSVYPLPGSPTASPETVLSFRGASARDARPIKVRGQESGRHAGKIRRHPDGNGFNFVPAQSFEPGEEVRVRTRLPIRGAQRGDFSFTVASRYEAPDPPEDGREKMSASRAKNFHDFVTRPGLHPPKVDVTTSAGPRTAKGHIFYTPKDPRSGVEQEGPMIVNDKGEIVWYHPLDGVRAADFKVGRYRGQKVLVWWQGHVRHTYGGGELVIADDKYRVIERVHTANGYEDVDGHEVRITPRGTALFLIKNPVWWDVPGDGRGERPVLDGIIQEVDIATGRLLFEWHSLDHIDVRETYRESPGAERLWDWLHANSIEVDRDGDFLMSARHTSAVYKIDRETGRIVWRLGGKRSDFEMGEGTTFSFQHDARRRPDGTITIFDNANGAPDPPSSDASRGMVVRLDREAMTASLVREYPHPQGELATAEANMQTLPNGNVFVGWGNWPGYTEFTAGGEVAYGARVPPKMESYRAYRFPWEGHPATDPRAAVERAGDGKTHVYASWNGATEVASWQVMAGPSRGRLRPVTSAPQRGFETRITVSAKADFFAVRARDPSGDILGTSRTHRAP